MKCAFGSEMEEAKDSNQGPHRRIDVERLAAL